MYRPRFEPETSLAQVQIVIVKPTCAFSPHQFHANGGKGDYRQ